VASSLDVLDANDKLYKADVAMADARGGWASRAWRWTGPWADALMNAPMTEPDRAKLADSARAETGSPGFDEIEREGAVAPVWPRRLGAGAVLPALVGGHVAAGPRRDALAALAAWHSPRVGVGVLTWWKAGRHRGSDLHRGRFAST